MGVVFGRECDGVGEAFQGVYREFYEIFEAGIGDFYGGVVREMRDVGRDGRYKALEEDEKSFVREYFG